MKPAVLIMLVVGLSWLPAVGEERFPPPDFTSHQLPATSQPPPRAPQLQWLDVAALTAALAAASYLALRRRKRGEILTLMLLSLAYFGFYRKGCICAIGAIQNVTMAIFDSSYALPLAALAFFLLPLVFTLLFGRTFCAAVCPLGAVQDVVLLKPLRVPAWLEHALGLLPYLYLGTAVLLAATGSLFLICQYDPFVGFFRLSGELNLLVLGGCLLLVGVFVGRPYCRFLCPYGAILRWLSPLAKWHASITPRECIKCRLCENACPLGAIQKPTAAAARRSEGKGALAAMLALLPVLVAAGTLGGWRASGAISQANATICLAQQVRLEEMGKASATAASAAFRSSGGDTAALYSQAQALRERFAVGTAILGGLVGLVVGGKLVSLSIRRTREDFRANRSTCMSCGRCFKYCPVPRAPRRKDE